MSVKKPKTIELNFELWPRQLTAFNSIATELLYGGAAGGGKSHLERVLSIVWCLEIPGLQYYLFRRHFSDLIKSYVEGPTGYQSLLAPLVNEGQADCVAKEVRFPNGSKIFLCHCQYEKDVYTFGSFEFHVLNIAEAGDFTPDMMKFLRSRVRAPVEFLKRLPKKFELPEKYWRVPGQKEWMFPRIINTANPVGVGKLHLKKSFVDGHEPEEIWRAPDEDGGMLRQFIPAKLSDNPSIIESSYTSQLKGIGSKGYVDALLNGLWTSTVGAFYPELDHNVHMIKPFPIPDHWARVVAMDWGGCGQGDPFAIGWFAIVDSQNPLYPRGAAILYRLWYGAGLPEQTVRSVAAGIKEREAKDPQIVYRVAGRDIFSHHGGPSIAEDFQNEGIYFRHADTDRTAGWQQLRNWLVGKTSQPDIYCFDTYEQWFEYMSVLQYDHNNPLECLQESDHIGEMTRYFVMSRSRPQEKPLPPEVIKAKIQESFKPKPPTVNDLWSEYERIKNM